jgi:hypothetical protein
MAHRFPFALLLSTTVLLASAAAHADTPGASAAGPLPSKFPSHLLIGINSSTPDDTWAKQSGTKWDVQWLYLSGQSGNNWYNGWGGSPADGSWIDSLFSTIDGYGFIPGIHLYNVGYGHDTGDAGLLTEIQQTSFSTAYFTEFKALMQHAKTFGKPVLIVLEGDSFGMLEMLANNDPTTVAAVASTGLPELASLPNTIAGFLQAYLAIRKSVGAYNVAMGPDTPYYAANGDIMNFGPSDTDDLQSHVDYQWKFFGPFVGPNATGERFDFSASCPDAADCASYTDGRPCWDPSDSASVNTPSVNRYLEWLKLYNQTSGLRWVLHQVPLGNSQHRNVPYDGTARSGYKDNKAEYMFQVEMPASMAIRDQHLANFANAGVISVLFGSSDDGDTPSTDLWKDNMPFLKTHVALVNNGGGFAIASAGSGSSSASSSGGSSGAGSGAGPGGSSGSAGSSGAVGGSGGGSGGSSGQGAFGSSSGKVAEDGGTGQNGAASFDSASSSGCACSEMTPSPWRASATALGLLAFVALLRRRER